MSTLRKRITAPIAIVLALAITPALAGCFSNPLEQIVEQATGGDVQLGGKNVPAGFPQEVPLVQGEVVFGAGIGGNDGKIWNVTIKVGGANALDGIVAQLEGAGFTSAGFGGATDSGGTAMLENDRYGVLVLVTKEGSDGFVANYTVSEKKQ